MCSLGGLIFCLLKRQRGNREGPCWIRAGTVEPSLFSLTDSPNLHLFARFESYCAGFRSLGSHSNSGAGAGADALMGDRRSFIYCCAQQRLAVPVKGSNLLHTAWSKGDGESQSDPEPCLIKNLIQSHTCVRTRVVSGVPCKSKKSSLADHTARTCSSRNCQAVIVSTSL